MQQTNLIALEKTKTHFVETFPEVSNSLIVRCRISYLDESSTDDARFGKVNDDKAKVEGYDDCHKSTDVLDNVLRDFEAEHVDDTLTLQQNHTADETIKRTAL